MPTSSEVVYVGPAIIVQGESEVEVSCRVTVTRRLLDSSSRHVHGAASRWAGHFSATTGHLDEADGAPTFLRLPGGQKHEIAVKNISVDESGATVGTFFGRGCPPGG